MKTYNNHQISDALALVLTAVQSELTGEIGAPAAARIKSLCCRGQYGAGDRDSGNTHADGEAVDYLTASLSDDHIRVLVRSLQRHGAQAVLRLVGDDDGASRPVDVQHVHAARNGRSNSAALAVVTRESQGRWCLSKQLGRRGKR